MGKGNSVSPLQTWQIFSPAERRNILIYIAGIMLYKFGLEAFNGSVVALATNRYDFDADKAGVTPKTFERVAVLTGLNQAFQCIGSILIAPLIKRYPTKLVLSAAICLFGLLTAVLLILDASTGGRMKPKDWLKTHDKDDFSYYGRYTTDGIIPIYCVTGIAYGMVELIRRVIPRDIVGGDVQKLRRMDAMVHIFYEIAGTAGAFTTALVLIPTLGNNYSFLITPIFFTLAAGVWLCISNFNFVRQLEQPKVKKSTGAYILGIFTSVRLFFVSIFVGGRILFTSRKFFWLLPGYALALYGHRYLENGVAPVIARRYLGNSAWSQIMVGGSNSGELLGALFVFIFTNLVHTPMPWLRLDALTLLIVWYLPFWYPAKNVTSAWIVAATFIPVSFGWAAGDVSLAAYIQSSLAQLEGENKDVSALGAVMSFLYSTYIILYAVLSVVLGRHIDSVYQKTGGSKNGGNVREAVLNVGGIQFTLIAIIVIAATFVPKGSFAFNPKALSGQKLDSETSPDSTNDSKAEMDAETDEKERPVVV